ncbi:hypothetical protein IAU60_003580 [Kwoniella sp. DSM 27419]
MSTRPAQGYIDQAGAQLTEESDPPSTIDAEQFEDARSSGSSIEEESDGQPFDAGSSDEEELSHMSESGIGHQEIDSDWDVDDEDWELANGARNAPASVSKPATATGVAMNPKVAQVRQDKDKSDRATQDQVLDSRTRLVLAGLVNRNVIGKIERCANVYYASPGVAVKIYRTSILNFRSRANYIVGEQRFRGEYTSSKNPRKMIRVWAEKELRNLRRLVQGGVRAPTVHDCKENVLVMDFLGHGDELKDAEIDPNLLQGLYFELLMAVRRMYQICHLVHADLSEYNILLHEGHLWIIDVSQSVEHDHPKAFDFLRADLSNVEDFFGRRGVKCLGLRRSWEFAVTEDIGLDKEAELVDSSLQAILIKWADAPSDKTDDAVFLSSYIPRTLAEVYDPERDVDVLKQGGGDNLIYAGVTGLKLAPANRREDSIAVDKGAVDKEGEASEKPKKKVQIADQPITATEAVSVEAEASSLRMDDPHGSDASDSGNEAERRPRGFRHEDKESKKERKKAVKEENREKRKTKMPKAEKQRLMKKNSHK